jgi:hypothetical protein
MLKGENESVDLGAERDQLLALCAVELQEIQQRFGLHAINVLSGVDPVTIDYPVQGLPEKITSLDLDKSPEISGMLLGIKGQYLLLDSGVINIRKYTGYELELQLS